MFIIIILIYFDNLQSSSRSYISEKWNGRLIEKEIITRQLQDGITEKVVVMKDGNQKCITTITENSKTRHQNCNKQLINLDESNYFIFTFYSMVM